MADRDGCSRPHGFRHSLTNRAQAQPDTEALVETALSTPEKCGHKLARGIRLTASRLVPGRVRCELRPFRRATVRRCESWAGRDADGQGRDVRFSGGRVTIEATYGLS
jgi:hypothetical protein